VPVFMSRVNSVSLCLFVVRIVASWEHTKSVSAAPEPHYSILIRLLILHVQCKDAKK
jgi:hypothetical protein